jgi:hypothetical protein
VRVKMAALAGIGDPILTLLPVLGLGSANGHNFCLMFILKLRLYLKFGSRGPTILGYGRRA